MNLPPFTPPGSHSRLRSRLLVSLLVLTSVALALAAPRVTSTPLEGLRDASPRVHALVGGRIVVAPGKVIEKGTLVLRDGVVAAVGVDVAVPADARTWDVSGTTLYPGFIESQATLFLPEAWKPAPLTPPPASAAAAPRAEPATGTRAWNARITPERSVERGLTPDAKGAEKLRGLGFTVAHVAPARGIFRGQSALLSLGDAPFNQSVVRGDVAQNLTFEFTAFGGGGGEITYPTSLMGSIALTRQTLADAQWYATVHAAWARRAGSTSERPETNAALAALGPVIRGEQLVLFEAVDELDLARARNLAAEFKLRLAVRGTGAEYRVLPALAAAKMPVVLPLDFPDVPEIETPEKAVDVSLDQLQHWELAPANPGKLAAAGVPVALTTARLKKPESEFWARVRTAVERGLSADQALAALTTTPAELFGVAATHGTLDVGKAANVVVVRGDLFTSADAEIGLVWVDGDAFELDAWNRFDARGVWAFTWSGAMGPKEIIMRGARPARLQAKAGDDSVTAAAQKDGVLLFAPAKLFGGTEGTVRLAGTGAGDELAGTGQLPDGSALRWTAKRTGPAPTEPSRDKDKPKEKTAPDKILANTAAYPAGAFGRTAAPAQPEWLLVKNATVWTSADAGILDGADLLVRAGKIEKVGRGLAAPAGAQVIDATGKHVTAGIIDAHSHTAISRGVNEGGSSVTVEVRIGDVIDPTDINIYRQLAGGVTAINVLHGSANAMGGQNQVLKLRWGSGADDLKFVGAKPGVKFALGENVVRAGARTTRTRYPISRMGVRETFLDTFRRAADYEHEWSEFRAGRAPLAPRRDLRLEAAAEIARGDRVIHIHSYRQDEVLMFVRLAEDLKLPVATFQHILEGYKVAPEIAKLGAGASSFSDWWAYKVEVADAIPHNGALLHEQGVVTSFNSDSNELARRLNTEAAKATKYGGVARTEAWKFVTLNPAKQLRIADRVGSLEAGKDADFVIWNADPMSTYARPEQTWIDGRCYFDHADDLKIRAANAAERAALIQKALPARQKALAGGGGPGGGGGDDGGGAPPATFTLSIRQALAAAYGHETNEYRALYHNGADVHNCSTHNGGTK